VHPLLGSVIPDDHLLGGVGHAHGPPPPPRGHVGVCRLDEVPLHIPLLLHPALHLHQRARPHAGRRPPHAPPVGLTSLLRVGTGLVFAIVAMAVSALARREDARGSGATRCSESRWHAGQARVARRKPRTSAGRSSRWCIGRVSRRHWRGSRATLEAGGMETKGTREMRVAWIFLSRFVPDLQGIFSFL
jgi:hypothetical protein